MNHIEFTDLLRSFEEEPTIPEDRTAVQSHLSECLDCRTTYQKLAAFFHETDAMKRDVVPQRTTAMLLNIFQPRPPAQEPEAETRAPFLVFDDWSSLVFERHGDIGTRQLLYRFGEYELELQIEFFDDQVVVRGQILPDAKQAQIRFTGSDAEMSAVLNAGDFEIGPLPLGDYDIVIRIDGNDTKIEGIKLHH